MAEIATNRDLYFAITQLIAQNEKTARPLEEYLRALLEIGYRVWDRPLISPADFVEMLDEAFTGKPQSLSFEFMVQVVENQLMVDPTLATLEGYHAWVFHIFRQIVDLREMAENGQLALAHRYLGIDSPRGSRWYNFDPCGFLECATAGTFGGRDWDDEDESEVEPLGEISWEQFRDFLWAGQAYE